MAEENLSQEFRSKNVEETKNYFIEETDKNVLMRKKARRLVQHNL